MLGLVLLIKGLTVIGPVGVMFYLLCEAGQSPEDSRYWARKVKVWERERASDSETGRRP